MTMSVGTVVSTKGDLMSISSMGSSTSSLDFSAMRKQMADRMADRMLKDLDTDGDGKISKSELLKASQAAASSSSSGSSSSSSTDSASLDALFTALDSDGDGSVSKAELSAFVEKTAPKEPPSGAPPAGGPPPGGPPPPMSGTDSASSSSSTDASGSTSATSTSATNDPADTDNDGTVSAQERMVYAYKQLMAALQSMSETASQNANTASINVTS
jgi:hypothetical protein